MEASRLQTPDKTKLEYEFIWCEIDRERDAWLELRHRVDRTRGGDSVLNAHYDMVNSRVDYLLEELFTKMGQLSVLGIAHGSPAGA
jgi:hypothetical protein